jgi:hypothetical protein
MGRTQLYLDDNLWNVLHTRARTGKTTISELVLEAVASAISAARKSEGKLCARSSGFGKRNPPPPPRWSTSEISAVVTDWNGCTNDDGSRRLRDFSRGRNADVIAGWIESSSSDADILYSPVSVAELWAGARPSEYDALENLFSSLACAPINSEAGRHAGNYLRQFRRSHAVEIADAFDCR